MTGVPSNRERGAVAPDPVSSSAERGRPARPWVPGERIAGTFEPEPELPEDAPTVGVVAVQGDVLEHLRALRRAGAHAVRVRRPRDLDGLDGLIVPGGESTTIGRLLDISGLLEPLRERVTGGLPVFGTCAGMILLSDRLEQEREQPRIGGLCVTTRRNAFGRQVDSFEADLDVDGLDGGPVHAVFIRAPWIEAVGDDVEILAEVDGHPVLVVQGDLMAAAFHPELTDDDRLHRLFVDRVKSSRR